MKTKQKQKIYSEQKINDSFLHSFSETNPISINLLHNYAFKFNTMMQN